MAFNLFLMRNTPVITFIYYRTHAISVGCMTCDPKSAFADHCRPSAVPPVSLKVLGLLFKFPFDRIA